MELTSAGRKRHPLYRVWQSMIERCRNKDNKYYGGRGISVCDAWICSFERFIADMGERPPGTSIDRIDNDGNYEPGNCRWATRHQQSGNMRRRGRLPKLGRVDGVPMVAFRVSREERDAIQSAAGLLSVNEFSRRRTLAGLMRPETDDAEPEAAPLGIRVVYDNEPG